MRYKLHNKCLIDTKKHILIKSFGGCRIDSEDNIKIIEKAAFQFTSITELEIPNTVEEIRDYAFCNCKKLTHIKLPTNLKALGKFVFRDCNNLINIKIPENIKSIPKGLFKNCTKIKNIEYSNDITEFGNQCFAICTKLEKIIVPDTVKAINDYAFQKCESVERIFIPHNVDSIKETAFQDWTSKQIIIHDNNSSLCQEKLQAKIYNSCLKNSNYIATKTCYGLNLKGCLLFDSINFSIPKEIEGIPITTIDSLAFKFSNIKTLFIPNTIKTILHGAFADCIQLYSIEFENKSNLNSIGSNVFDNCSKLENITIPASVTELGNQIFANCTRLKSIRFEANSKLEKIGSRAFENCTKLETITLPASIKKLCSQTFTNCARLNSIEFEDNSKLQSIEPYPFDNNIKLESITIPAYVTEIRNETFANNTQLKSIDFEENSNLKTIGTKAFYNCKQLESVKLPPSLTTIEDYAFAGCNKLKTIIIPKATKYIGYRAFQNNEHTPNNYIFIEYDTNTSDWNYEWTSITYYKTVKNYSNEYSISINNSVVTLLHYYGNEKNIVIPKTLEGLPVKLINANCFTSPCIETIYIPETILGIERGAINNCCNLTNIKIAENSKSMIFLFLWGCPNLNNIECDPKNLYFLGKSGCLINNTQRYTHQTSDIKKIDDSAFYKNDKISEVIIPSCIRKIGRYAFSKCPNLKTVFISRSVIHIGVGAFKECKNIESIVLTPYTESTNMERKTTRIWSHAFEKCPKLKLLYLGYNVDIFNSSRIDLYGRHENEMEKIYKERYFKNN